MRVASVENYVQRTDEVPLKAVAPTHVSEV